MILNYKKRFSLFKVSIFLLLECYLGISSVSGSHSLLEELGIYSVQKVIKISSSLEKIKKHKKFLDEKALPRELMTNIFNTHISLLRPVARLNHEWHQWAQPRVSARYRLYKKCISYSYEPKNCVYLIFDIERNIGNDEYIYYNKIRSVISEFSATFDLKDQPIFQETQVQVKWEISDYQSIDKRFDFQKLIRAWTEYQDQEESIKIINKLWEGQNYLKGILDKNLTTDWFAKIHIQNRCTPQYGTTTLLSYIIFMYFDYCRDFLNNNQFQDPLGKLVYDFIELDKLILASNKKTQEIYARHPNNSTMDAFHFVEVDLDQNTPKIQQEKLKILRKNLIEYTQKNFITAIPYINIIQRQLSLG